MFDDQPSEYTGGIGGTGETGGTGGIAGIGVIGGIAGTGVIGPPLAPWVKPTASPFLSLIYPFWNHPKCLPT